MPLKRAIFLLILVLAVGGGVYVYRHLPPAPIMLTGLVTTNDVIVSPQIAGQVSQLLVQEGEKVKKDQLLAVLTPDELRADTAYYTQNVAGLTSQVQESEAALRFQQRQTTDQINQAQSMLASTEAQVTAATAELENARLLFTRTQDLAKQKVVSPQELDQARTSADSAQAKLDALKRQVEA